MSVIRGQTDRCTQPYARHILIENASAANSTRLALLHTGVTEINQPCYVTLSGQLQNDETKIRQMSRTPLCYCVGNHRYH